MDALFAAIMTKCSGSALSTDVGGRIFMDEYGLTGPPVFPYVIFSLVTDVPDDVFAKDGEEALIQFDLFSSSKGAAEITGMYGHLKALFDDASLTVTGYTMPNMRRVNTTTSLEEITTGEGEQTIRHWSVDYEVLLKAS